MALEPQEILQKIGRVIEIWKPFNPNNLSGQKAREDGKVPEYYPMYPLMVNYRNQIMPHAEKGAFPVSLFKERSPNQTEEEFDYIKKNFKQKTLPVFMDFINVVSRAFNDGNWTIDYSEDSIPDDISFQQYVEEEIPIFGSLESFIKSTLPNKKLKDANAVLAIRPKDVPRNEEGEFLSGELLEPIPVYYRSDQLVSFKDSKYYIIELDRKSKVKHGNVIKKIGKVFEIYDDENIWIATQVGKFNDFVFELELFFNHNIGQVPVKRLMGVPQVIHDKVLYQSPFLFAVDNLDLVLLNSSNLQVSINMCVYPYRVMVGQICDFEDNEGIRCDGGSLFDHKNDTKRFCPKCNGTGLKTRVSPMGVMLLKPPTDEDAISEANISTPMQYISPDTTTLTFLREQIGEDLKTARRILHIKDTSSQVQGQEDLTATGRAIDQKQMFSFIKPISDQMFDIYGFGLDMIGEMRYGSSYVPPTLVPSVSFDFLTSDDYLVQIKEAVDANLPPFVIHTLIFKYLNTIFYNDLKSAKAFNLIIQTDRLLTHRNEDISAKLLNGTVAKWESVLHDSAVALIKDLLLEDPDFLKKELKDQKDALIERAKLAAQEALSDRPQPLDTGELVDRVIGRDTPQ